MQAKTPKNTLFSPTNLGYIKRFYLLYSNAFDFHPQLGANSLKRLILKITPKLRVILNML